MPMFLEFRGLLAKRTANALTELQLCSGPARVEIGEAFSAKVFHLCEEFLELSDATGELFNRGSFGSRAGLFGCFYSCHGVWEKSSPASTTWQENMGKRTRAMDAGCGRIGVPIGDNGQTDTSERGLVPPIRIERTTNGLGMCQDIFKKARCFKWFPRFLFEYRGLGTFQWLY